jgi:uncharacterized zinc-type alcohol dehydrogenase-like protein
VRDEWGASTFPMVPGHEIAGIVTEIGPKVTHYKMGDRVAVGCFIDSCRKCGPCLKGLEQYCIQGPTLTYNAVERDGKNRTQGGYSNKIIVDENYVLRIPENIPMNRAAPLLSLVRLESIIVLSLQIAFAFIISGLYFLIVILVVDVSV